MVRSWLRRVRWSATTSALVAVVALFGATAVASSLVADRQPAPSSPASVAASLASASTHRPTTTAPRVATTGVERRPVPPPTTSTTAEVLELPPAARTTIVTVDVGPEAVTFATSTDPSAACEERAQWSVARTRPDANVVVSEDGLRLEERDPATGEVIAVLATWDEAAGRPTGDGVTEAAAPSGCAPEDPASVSPTSTVAA